MDAWDYFRVLKVSSHVAKPGAEFAVYDCSVGQVKTVTELLLWHCIHS